MAIVLSGSTNDITVNGVSVATDAEVSSAVADAVQTGLVTLQTIATGTATFTATTNNINLTGIGLGVEIGDVIQISGSTNNNGEFTIEVITNNNNVIVNQAHAGKSRTVSPIGTKALINETATITVKLLAKYYNASDGLGQGLVDVTAQRTNVTVYPNITNRRINVNIFTATTSSSNGFELLVNGERYSGSDFPAASTVSTINTPINAGYNYKMELVGTVVLKFMEVR